MTVRILDAKEALSLQKSGKGLLVDCRGEARANEGHVKGALVISWQELCRTDVELGAEGWGHIPEAPVLARLLGEHGFDLSRDIIAYSDADKGFGEDGRILWELKVAGFEGLFLVNGGFEALKAEGAEIVTEIEQKAPCDVKVDAIDRSTIIDTKELTDTIEDYKLVDAREQNEYEGAQIFGEAVGGHIPGAINIPHSSLYDERGFLKALGDLETLFSSKGLQKEDAIVVYCTGGIRAGLFQLLMELCGYRRVKNYEGSYYNWCRANEVE